MSLFAAVGMTTTTVAEKVYPEYAAHDLWQDCLKANSNSEIACINNFSSVGLTTTTVQAAFFKYLKRDHGWYPETEAEAYPWLDECLNK